MLLCILRLSRWRAAWLGLVMAGALAWADVAAAEPAPLPPPRPDVTPSRDALCLMLESAASAHGIPVDFFTRVIWRESRFNPRAVGPVTRSGQRAQGIAQFMPGTAAERDLADPFNPVEALPKAAAFLSELRRQFGNLGLAAAAYNAGPQRVSDWLAGTRTLPGETRRYVAAITGHGVDEWASAAAAKIRSSAPDCETLMASLRVAPSGFAYELEQRVTVALAKPWGVQLAAGFSRARVLRSYARAMQRLKPLVGAHDPVLTRHLVRSRGTRPLYQARIGADSRKEAGTICGKIRKAGGACMVMRTRH